MYRYINRPPLPEVDFTRRVNAPSIKSLYFVGKIVFLLLLFSLLV